MASTDQRSIFDPVQGEILRERAIRQVDKNADADAKAELLKIGRYVAGQRSLFTTDAIRYIYEKQGTTTMREPRLLGAIMRQLHKEGVCEPTATIHQSTWAKNHRRPLRVWKSLISDKKANLTHRPTSTQVPS